jgi:PAS domain S-box-containing protein
MNSSIQNKTWIEEAMQIQHYIQTATIENMSHSMDAQQSNDILDRIKDGFFTLDDNLIITAINPVTRAFIGKRKSCILGKSILDIFESPDRINFFTRYLNVLKNKVVESFEETYEGHFLQVQVYPKKSGGIAVFWRDITIQKNAESDLIAALAQRNEFISTASHELKTPLAALMLQMEMAKRSSNLSPEKVSKILDNTHRDVLRLKRLVDDMLDVSRIASGKLSMDFEFFHLDDFMEELLERMKPAFPQFDKVKIHFNAPVIVHWDRFRIEQVVVNLLTNAFRYGEDQNISIHTKIGGNRASIVVKDFGMGIAKENLNKIFERFERGSNTRETSGLGLGLYICQEIVNHHQGQIIVQSVVGAGSTFTVELPFNRLNNSI